MNKPNFVRLFKKRGSKRDDKDVSGRNKERYVCKICYVFWGLFFACAIVFVIWVAKNSYKEKDGSDTLTTKKVNDLSKDSCPVSGLVGDGFCDDKANIPECEYDAKDCCKLENDRSLCENCSCITNQMERDKYIEEHCKPDFIWFDIGDGSCDLNLNKAEHFFDAGDCCLPIEDLVCRTKDHPQKSTNYNYQECPENPCIISNNFCILEELGDGKCQDHNNGPFCNYDLGDCCLKTKLFDNTCCTCSCSQSLGTFDWTNYYTNTIFQNSEIYK